MQRNFAKQDYPNFEVEVIQSKDSLTVASLPYFSPAMSVILLLVVPQEPVRILLGRELV